MQRLVLKPNEERRLLRGHLWAYRSEFKSPPDLPDGAIADVYTQKGKFVGRGFYQAAGGIAVRILDRHQTDIDDTFFHKRVETALDQRRLFYPGTSVYRWIHGESDGLPGVVADRYGPVVAAQTACTFYRDHLAPLTQAFLSQDGIEGVRIECAGSIHTSGEVPGTIEIVLDELRYTVPLAAGQKTGFFLDQRENARMMDQVAPGARVLDGHCNAGQWACHAARAGAASVLAVDSAPAAIALAGQNATNNGLADRCHFECSDVEHVLERGETFDVICLDPPALAKGRGQAKKALGRYQALNRNAMKALAPGGFLMTSSCSQPVDQAAFLEMLKRAARSAQRSATVLALHGAPPDHPVLLAMPETAYLKCALVRLR